jgi:N-acetylglucosamine-6-phosphate deacetylase
LQGGGLAGSVLTLDRALRNLAAATGVEPAALWPTASANAAQSAGVADRKGRLEPGLDADLVLLDADATVQATVVEGQPAYVGLGARELETV